MTFEERNYLVTIDYYSSFIGVDPLPDTASRSVITIRSFTAMNRLISI